MNRTTDDSDKRTVEWLRERIAELAANRQNDFDEDDCLPLPPSLEAVLANERAQKQQKAQAANASVPPADPMKSHFARANEVDYLPLPPSTF